MARMLKRRVQQPQIRRKPRDYGTGIIMKVRKLIECDSVRQVAGNIPNNPKETNGTRTMQNVKTQREIPKLEDGVEELLPMLSFTQVGREIFDLDIEDVYDDGFIDMDYSESDDGFTDDGLDIEFEESDSRELRQERRSLRSRTSIRSRELNMSTLSNWVTQDSKSNGALNFCINREKDNNKFDEDDEYY